MTAKTVSLTKMLLLLLVVTVLAGPVESAAPPAGTPALLFVENAGQFAPGAHFKVLGADRDFWLADEAIWITLREGPASAHPAPAPSSAQPPTAGPPRLGADLRGAHLRLTFPGANPDAELLAYQPVDTTISYFLGNDPAGWRADVPVWAGVRYHDLYPNLDLAWDQSAGRLYLSCRAGDCVAALAQVRLRVEGAERAVLDGDALRLTTAAGDFRLPLLTVRDAAGVSVVTDAFTPELRRDVLAAPFADPAAAGPGAYEPADDPGDLLYSTFLGGVDDDNGSDLVLDAAGNATIIGFTESTDFPTTPGAFDTALSGSGKEVFVTRLNAAGSALIYSTYLGGTDSDRGFDLALDSFDRPVLTGITDSEDFPTTAGAFDRTYAGEGDVFVARLSADGSALSYSTYLGGSDYDCGTGLAVDGERNVTLTGYTFSTTFPTTPGAFDTSFNGGDFTSDTFVARLNAAGSELLYSTFLGGSEIEYSAGLALDAAGNATLTGSTFSTDFPTTAGAFDTEHNGGDLDAYVTRLNAAGSALLFSTFLGGSDSDRGEGVELDATGSATLTGYTYSTDFPTTAGAFDTEHGGGRSDVFVTRLNGAGNALLYSTYLGGSNYDEPGDIELDEAGNATITGSTFSADFPTTPGAFRTSFGGHNAQVFVSRLNAAGADLLYSTFLGRGKADHASGVAVDGAGHAVVTGATDSPHFPTTPGAFDTTFNAGTAHLPRPDCFVSKLRMEEPTDVGVSAFGREGAVAGGRLWLLPALALILVAAAVAGLRRTGGLRAD